MSDPSRLVDKIDRASHPLNWHLDTFCKMLVRGRQRYDVDFYVHVYIFGKRNLYRGWRPQNQMKSHEDDWRMEDA